MKVKTAEISISAKTKDAIINNWNSCGIVGKSLDVLDSGIILRKEHFQTTLRVPYTIRRISGYMLLSTDVAFTVKKENQLILSILCNVVKPVIIYTILGFLTAFVILFPVFHDWMNFIFIALGGIVVSGIYFGLFYLKMKRLSNEYAEELIRKNR